MMYDFEIIAIDPLDQDDITISIDGIVLRCWAGNSPELMVIGERYSGDVFIDTSDELILKESKVKEKNVTQLNYKKFDCLLRGILDIEKGTLDVGILLDFGSHAQLYDYGFLHDKYVECVVRIQLFVRV